ncbi:mechanosensitive ion channel protein MscS [Labilibaculum filiforme]|uniref:Mechanosensitive ion channel protein MscS n=1 Tax=Labilibaculum filiforme TaxID=1940526 RepID=A0A2N3I0R8_9BACT|nr:mechanosensitive ion channel family protein [Labilibaculum filiforme]PKQ63857.1 mechanosensitive ion channel protein MscS [Labilibaculum filiforme]
MNNFFNKELVRTQLIKVQEWIITDLTAIVIITIALFIALKFGKYFIHGLTKTLLSHSEKNEKIDTLEAEKRIKTLMGIISGVFRIMVYSIYFMILLQKFGINIAPILASAGIIGLAVGFGAQELVRDVISGFFILLEDQIRTGDVAIINGTGGLVEKIELRTITLRDFSGVVHIFQNGKINTLSNRTKEWSAAVFEIGVAYKEDVQQVMDIMAQIGKEVQEDATFTQSILEPIEIMGLDQFGDSALIIKARIKTKPSMQWVISREFNKRLKVAFDKHNIEIPFPHTTIYWGDKIAPLHLEVNDSKISKS